MVIVRGGVESMMDDPMANSVFVVGVFDNWSTSAHSLTKDPSGKWCTAIPL